MINHSILCLLEATLAASSAVLIVGSLRRLLRRAMGARAAYWVWLLVPAGVLAVLLPAPAQPVTMFTATLPHSVGHAVTNVVLAISEVAPSSPYTVVALLAWLAGASAMSAFALYRQRNFVRSLGSLSPRADGTYRSDSGVGPMVVGFWRPRIVLPSDFEARYTPEEASLILAHERAHLRRGDAPVNAIATAWLCLLWFDPLMYLALGWLRFDQDLASDALVLAAENSSRRRYATALLKTQLISDASWRLPVGCQWGASHPLKERIDMLRRPLPGHFHRSLGVLIAVMLVISSGCAVWKAQPMAKAGNSTAPIAVRMEWLLNGVDLLGANPRFATKDFLVAAGDEFTRSFSSPGQVQQITCVISLPNTRHSSPDWHTAETWKNFRKTSRSTDGLLLVECIWRENGNMVMSPSMVFADGGPAAVAEVTAGGVDRRVEFTASVSPTTALKSPPSDASRVSRRTRSGVCLVTTSCWALAKKTPPRLCPDGALSCEPGAGQVIPLFLHEQPPPPDR